MGGFSGLFRWAKKRRPTLRESRPSFKEKGDKSCFTVLYYSNKRASILSFYFFVPTCPIDGLFWGGGCRSGTVAEYKIFNRHSGEEQRVWFFVLLFQDVVWMQIFLYRKKKVFFRGRIGNAGRDIPGAKKKRINGTKNYTWRGKIEAREGSPVPLPVVWKVMARVIGTFHGKDNVLQRFLAWHPCRDHCAK